MVRDARAVLLKIKNSNTSLVVYIVYQEDILDISENEKPSIIYRWSGIFDHFRGGQKYQTWGNSHIHYNENFNLRSRKLHALLDGMFFDRFIQTTN